MLIFLSSIFKSSDWIQVLSKIIKNYNSFQSISPGLVSTEIVQGDFAEKMEAHYGIKILQPKDIADAAIYTLSTPPNCQVRKSYFLTVLKVQILCMNGGISYF